MYFLFISLSFLSWKQKFIKMLLLHSSPCPRQTRNQKIFMDCNERVGLFYNKVDCYFLKIRAKSIKEVFLCINDLLSCFFGILLCSVLRLRRLLIFFINRTMEDGNLWHLAMNDKAHMFLFLRIKKNSFI